MGEAELLKNVSAGICPGGRSCRRPQTVVSCIACWRETTKHDTEDLAFDHSYSNLYNQDSAELLDVRKIEVDDTTSPEFLDRVIGCKPERGSYILLVFLGNLNIPFVVTRSLDSPHENIYERYRACIGDKFNIVVTKNIETVYGGIQDEAI